MAAISRLPMRRSVMVVAPVAPLRVSLAVHGVGRDLVTTGEGVPFPHSIFGIISERPTH